MTLRPDGTRILDGIVPSIATADYVFPGYAKGAGPDRTPNTFGGFALRLGLAPDTASGSQGPAGPARPPGPRRSGRPPSGPQGERGLRTQVAVPQHARRSAAARPGAGG